jgi:hypothetical protein
MSTKLFKRPEIDKTALLEELEKSIFDKTERVEALDRIFKDKNDTLEAHHSSLKSAKEKEIADIENILAFKRQEHEQLLKPTVEREIAVGKRETDVFEREKSVFSREQDALEKEQEATKALSDLENLSDEIGDTKVSLDRREKIIAAKESALKDKENEYLFKVDDTNKKHAEKDAHISSQLDDFRKREYALDEREISLNNKEKELNILDQQVKDKYKTLEITLTQIKK